MGRVQLQIKKIENRTSRQVTFSKRRNGLIKKAYELSVLCDVDVALLMFSPSGRVSLFSGKKRIEDILMHYINLPEHERGRLHNQEFLQRTLEKMKNEIDPVFQSSSNGSPKSAESQVEDLQHDIHRCQYELKDVEKRLRSFEGDYIRITSLNEADYHEKVLEETLHHVQLQKQVLEEQYLSQSVEPSAQAYLHNANTNGFVTGNLNRFLDWLPPRDPQIQILNGLLPLRDQTHPLAEFLSPPATFIHGNNVHLADHIGPSSGVEDASKVYHAEFGHGDANLSQWTEHYPTENGHARSTESRGQALLELFLSHFAS